MQSSHSFSILATQAEWSMNLQIDTTSREATSIEHDEFLSLIEKHQRLLLKVCWAYTFTSHDRDDLLQEIMVRLWSAFAKYDRNRRFSTWMYRVAINVSIDFCRRKGRTKESESLDNVHEVALPADATKQEQLREMHELLEQQNEAERAILLLYLEGNSHREIGEVLGISESNVATRLSRLKKSLRRSTISTNREAK